jgi:peroxiredoxin
MSKLFIDPLAKIRSEQSEAGRERYDALVKHLIVSGAVDGALKEGAVFPDFQLATAEGRFMRRDELLAKGPAVLAFYRGVWCPYCSAELNALAQIAPQVRAAGASIVAITPEAGGTALRIKFERELETLDIACDLDNVLALECGLVFPVPDNIRNVYMAVGIDFEKLYGNNSWMLPVPATYVVRKDGIIAKAYVNPDFRHRLAPEEILGALAALR